jgi:hypothetical protein
MPGDKLPEPRREPVLSHWLSEDMSEVISRTCGPEASRAPSRPGGALFLRPGEGLVENYGDRWLGKSAPRSSTSGARPALGKALDQIDGSQA